jgi:hypothetical protein
VTRWERTQLEYVRSDLLAFQEFADVQDRHRPKLISAIARVNTLLNEVQSNTGETTAMANKKKSSKKKTTRDSSTPINRGRQHVHESQPQGGTPTGGAGGSATDEVRHPGATREEDEDLGGGQEGREDERDDSGVGGGEESPLDREDVEGTDEKETPEG